MNKQKILLLIGLMFILVAPAFGFGLERDIPLDTTTVSANFGQFRSATGGYKIHDGIDYPTKEGEPVYAVAGGTAKYYESSSWGKHIIVQSIGFETRYAHLSSVSGSPEVNVSYPVNAGDIIGKVGHTGAGTGNHLHFGIGQTVSGGNQVNPITHGLKQPAYGDAVFNKVVDKGGLNSTDEYIVFMAYDGNGSNKHLVNNGITNQTMKIICEAYQAMGKFTSNPYKVKFTVTKKDDSSYLQTKEITFESLSFDVEEAYRASAPYRSYFSYSNGDYKNFFQMAWTPSATGEYEVEVKTFVAYWNGDDLIYPNDSNPEAGRTHTKTRVIEVADTLIGLIDSAGVYAWQPPASAASAAGIRAADISWPSPRYVTDLSNTIFTTNTADVSPDFQKYTEFTVAATRNTDWTIKIKSASSGTELETLTASGQETIIKWDGVGMGSGRYKYEIEARDPNTGVVSTKEGISLITIDNDKPNMLTNWATTFPTKTSIIATNESTSVHFTPTEDLYSIGVNIVEATDHDNKIIVGLARNPNLKQNEVMRADWDSAGYYPEGTYQFEVVMTDLAGNINKRYSNPVVVNTSGNYVPPALENSPLDPPPYDERAIITDFIFDSSGNQYVLYGRIGQVVKYDNSGNVLASSDPNRIELVYPQALAVNSNTGAVYVTDTYNNRVIVYDENLGYLISISDGVIYYLRNWKKWTLFGPEGEFYMPADIVIAPDGQVYIVDSANHRILRFKEYSYYIIPGEVFSGIKYDSPRGYGYVHSSGINDSFNFSLSYNSSFIAQQGNFGDALGQFTSPESVAVASSGYIYVSDTGNNRVQKFLPDGSFLSKFGEDILNSPKGIDVDSHGNIWVADAGNKRIVQFDSSGKFVKEYKSEDYEIDPQKIVVRNGNIYIADANSSEPLVWNVAGEINNFIVSDEWLSPNNDGQKDDLNVYYNITQPANITVQAIPKLSGGAAASNADGGVILNNTPREIGQNEEVWSGSLQPSGGSAQESGNDNQNIIADGKYSLKVTAAFGDYKKSKAADINIDTEKPALALNRDPPGISPNGDYINDGMIIDYSLSDNLSPTCEVRITLWKNERPVEILLDTQIATTVQPITNDLVWDGKIANYIIEGNYILELEATDLAGNSETATAEILVDIQPPRIEALSLTNDYFSPNNDGKKDETEIKFNLNDTYSKNMMVTVMVEDAYGVKASTMIKREELAPGEHAYVWRGSNENGMVSDGDYVFRIYAEDEAGNVGTSESVPVVVDTVPPEINSFASNPNPFSPNKDGNKDRTQFSYQLSETCYSELRILREDNTLFRDYRLYNITEGVFDWDGSGVHGEILGEEHPYYLYAEDLAGNVTTSEVGTIIVQHEPSLVPYAFADPDPFAPVNPNNNTTQIKYYLTRDNLMVTVEVVGKEGRIVKSLVNGEIQNKGDHSVAWNGEYDPPYDGPRVGNKVADGSWEFKVIASASDEPNPANTANTVLVDNVPPYILADPVNVDVVNRSATLQYSIPETSSLEVAVYDDNDNLIDEIENTAAKSPGIYSASWQPAGEVNSLTYFKISAVDKALNQAEKITELFSVVPQEELQINNAYASPNPFTPNGDGLTDLTRIGYQISGGAPEYTVSINILTDTGATVKRLIDSEPQSPGTYSFYWNGLNDSKQLTADGSYKYEITVEDKLGTTVNNVGGILVVSIRPTLNLAISPTIISPNGDGSSDILGVDYSIDYPIQYITGDALVKLEVIDSSTSPSTSLGTSEAVWSRVFNHIAGSYSFQYDGTTTGGTSLPAGSYYLRGTAQDALGAIAIPKMLEFEVDYTQPVPSDFTITPQYAKLGTTVTIELEFQEELLDDPIVAIVGIGEASLESVSGNDYLYSYVIDADDPEGVATVSVEAQDLALNTITKTETFTIDKTDPQVSNVSIDPNPANQAEVKIGFDVDELLGETPKVYITQDGASPQMAIVSGQYEAKYNVITGYDGLALITIEVSDLANNQTVHLPGELFIIDTVAPAFTSIQSEIISNPDFSNFAKEGSEVRISFNTSEDLQFNPDVKINGNLASYDSLNLSEYKYMYSVADTDTEGNAVIMISGYDPAGNEGTVETSSLSESFVIDLVKPRVIMSHDLGMIANPSPFSTNASSEVGHRQTRLQYETSEYGYVTINIHRIPNSQETYVREDFNNDNLVVSYNESWFTGGMHHKFWNGEIQNNQAEYDKNSNGYADPGKYAFIVEVRDKAGNLIEGKWGGTCWIQDNVLDLIEPDQTALGHDNPRPQYFSPNGDGSLEATEVFFRVRLGVSPAEPATPEAISVFGVPDDFKWLETVVKTVGTYTVRVFDETKTILIKTITSEAALYSNTLLSETWDGRDDNGQYVAEGTYKIEIDARDYIGGQAENNLLTLTATVDVSAPQIVSNEPDQANTPWTNSGKSYDVDFFDDQNAYASKLKKAEYNVHYPSGGESGWLTLFDNLNLSTYADNWGASIFNGCEEGINRVSVRVIDNAGNETLQNDLFYVKRDVHAPSTNIPATTNPTNNNRPTWGWAASSDMSGIEGYYIKIGTSSGAGNIVGETWIGNAISWQTTTNLGNGTYYATIKAKDNAGNTGIWGSSGSVTVDISPPVISGISDSPDPFSPGNIDGNKDSITFYYTINETSTVTIYVDGASKYNGVDGAGSHSYPWAPGTSIGEGVHTYYIRAVDGVGNVRISSNYGFTVDNTPPVSNPTLRATSGNGVANLTWDSVGGADGYDIYRATSYNGAYIKVNSSLVTATNFQNGSLSNGSKYWYKVKAIDNAGNESGFSDYVAATPGILSGTKILFQSTKDGNAEIYKMNIDGTNQMRLTNHGADDYDPIFSPDGTKIVFMSKRDGNREIYKMNSDGSNKIRLTNNNVPDGGPSFSPDGTKIVFSRDVGSGGGYNWEIFIMNSDGSGQIRLTNNNNNVADIYPSFSPDGTKIVFNSNQDGTFGICEMNVGGGNRIALTDIAINDNGPPFYSPDGAKIVFSSERDGGSEIYEMDAHGNNIIRLTNNAVIDLFNYYSPDGTNITFASLRDGNFGVFTMDADGSNQTRLTPNTYSGYSPSWSPFAPGMGASSLTEQVQVQSVTLEVPLLNSPDDASNVTSLRPIFEWQHRKGDTREYKIDLAKNDSFAIDHQTFTKAPNTGSVDKNDPTLYHYTYSIHEFDPGLDRDTYYWKVTATSTSESATSEVRSFTVAPQLTLTGVTNYPNPFDPNRESTKIRYRLGADVDEVKIRIYDVIGSLVKEITNCPTNGEGSSVWSKYNDVGWDGRNGRGDLVRNGIYPFEIVARLGDKSVSARGKVAVLK